jgi:DNA recombination protein RmuC
LNAFQTLSEKLMSWLPGLPADAAAPVAIALTITLATGLLIGAVGGASATALILSRTNARLRNRFQSLSTEVLDRTSERFLALAGERLGALERSNVDALAQRESAVDALVRPLRESLARVDEKLHKVETEREG